MFLRGFKKPLLPHRVEPDVTAFRESLQTSTGTLMEFETKRELEQLVWNHFAKWLDAIKPVESPAGS